MPLKMKELPETERPYEKLKMYGAEKLSNAELLAIIIKTGTKEENSIEIANRILLLTQNLSELRNISINELTKIKGIGEIKAIQVKAISELAKRVNSSANKMKIQIKKALDVANLLMEELKLEKQEILKVLILNSKNIVIKIIDVVIGDTNVANVTVKQILTEAVKMQAPKIIIVHNHPSGDPTPSTSDYLLTENIIKACDIFGIEMLDHIIIGMNRYRSIKLDLQGRKD